MSRAIIFVCVLLLLVFLPVTAGAIDTIFVDGIPAVFPSATVSSGSLFVPVRPLAQAMGLDVLWDERTKTVELSGYLGVLSLTNSQRVILNGQSHYLTRAPFLRQGQLFVPLRTLIEFIGGHVDYVAASDTVFAYSPTELTRSLVTSFSSFDATLTHHGRHAELRVVNTSGSSVNVLAVVMSATGRLDFVEWIERSSQMPMTLLLPGQEYDTILRIPEWVRRENYVELLWVDSTRFRGIGPTAAELKFSYVVSFRPPQSNLD